MVSIGLDTVKQRLRLEPSGEPAAPESVPDGSMPPSAEPMPAGPALPRPTVDSARDARRMWHGMEFQHIQQQLQARVGNEMPPDFTYDADTRSLAISGHEQADNIHLAYDADEDAYQVSYVDGDGEQQLLTTVNADDVDEIRVSGHGGDDVISLDASLNDAAMNGRNMPTIVTSGQAGDDVVINQADGTFISDSDGNDTYLNSGDNVHIGQFTPADGEPPITGSDYIYSDGDNVNVQLANDGDHHVDSIGVDGSVSLEGEGDHTLNIEGHGRTVLLGDGDNQVGVLGNGNNLGVGHGNNAIGVTGNDNSVTTGDGHNQVTTLGNGQHILTGAGEDIVNVYGDDNHVYDASDPMAPGTDPMVPGTDPMTPGNDPMVPSTDPMAPGTGPMGVEPVAPVDEPEAMVHEHVVEPGDTLWDIAGRFGGNPLLWAELAEYNGIENPDLILPGQVIRIPEDWEMTETPEMAGEPEIAGAPEMPVAPEMPAPPAVPVTPAPSGPRPLGTADPIEPPPQISV